MYIYIQIHIIVFVGMYNSHIDKIYRYDIYICVCITNIVLAYFESYLVSLVQVTGVLYLDLDLRIF